MSSSNTLKKYCLYSFTRCVYVDITIRMTPPYLHGGSLLFLHDTQLNPDHRIPSSWPVCSSTTTLHLTPTDIDDKHVPFLHRALMHSHLSYSHPRQAPPSCPSHSVNARLLLLMTGPTRFSSQLQYPPLASYSHLPQVLTILPTLPKIPPPTHIDHMPRQLLHLSLFLPTHIDHRPHQFIYLSLIVLPPLLLTSTTCLHSFLHPTPTPIPRTPPPPSPPLASYSHLPQALTIFPSLIHISPPTHILYLSLIFLLPLLLTSTTLPNHFSISPP